MSSFLEQFVEEARENVEELVSGLLRLESEDTVAVAHTVRELFRYAHNIKGMSGAMGLDGITETAHRMEDLLDTYRQGGRQPTNAEVDILLAASDALDQMIDEAGAGANPPASEQLVVLLENHRHVSDDLTATVPTEVVPVPQADGTPEVAASVNPATRLEVRLADSTQLPGARSAIVLRAVAELTEVLATNPDRQAIEAGRAKSFVVEIPSGAADDVVATVATITDVTSISPVSPLAPATTGEGSTTPTPAATPTGAGSRVRGGRTTVRVEVGRLDDLMDLVSELVVRRDRLDEQASRVGDRDLNEAVATVHRTVADLQAMVAKIRMISLEKTFARLARIVRDTAREVDKPVRFVSSGEDTELDRSMVDEVTDPLMHLLRNSVDHGIEATADRIAAGKDRDGVVALRAASDGHQVVIEVSDDGGGIDVDAVVAKAIRNGMITVDEAAAMSTDARIDLIFAAGLSTREEASRISGRGVGMDVVRTATARLGGSITVETTAGRGTIFVICLPLSPAVVEALLVRIGGETWAIPIDQVEETLQVNEGDVGSVGGRPVMDLRGEVVSVIHGRRRMYGESPPDGPLAAVVCRSRGRRIALTVDDLIGRSEVVVNPLPPDLGDTEPAGSVTILGDGSVGLILDVGSVTGSSGRRMSPV